MLPALGYVMERYSPSAAIFICGGFVLLAALTLLANRDAKALLEQPNERIVGSYQDLYPAAFGSLPGDAAR